MKPSSIATLLSLVASVVSRVSSLTKPSTNLQHRDPFTLGCDSRNKHDQHIKFYSVDKVFGMWVPTDGSNYNIGRPSAQMKCSELASATATSDATCEACWDKILFVEIVLPGSCTFALTDDNGKLSSMQTDNAKGVVPFPKAGYLALVTCDGSQANFVRDIEVSTLGCTDPTGNDQHIEFHSSAKLFGMRTPMDGNNYNVGKPQAEMQCVDLTSSTQSTCAPCWDRMDHVELTRPGSCSFALTDDDGKLFSMTIDNTKGLIAFPKPGCLALVTCHKPQAKVARAIEDGPLACVRPNDTEIILDTGSQHYLLLLPANETVFELIGPNSNPGCVGPLQQGDIVCQACNFPVQSLELSPATGTCAFNFSGYANLIYHNNKDGILSLPSPTQIWSVACGLEDVSLKRLEILPETTKRDFGLRSPKSGCLSTDTGVVFNTTQAYRPFNQTYMAVPGDQQYYNLAGQSPELECYFFWEPTADPCHSCHDYEVVSLSVSPYLWACRFKIEGWTELLTWPVWHTTPMHFDPPIKVLGVQCGLVDPFPSVSATSAEDAKVNTEKQTSDKLARDNPIGAIDFLCSDAGYNITIFTEDGNVYCPPVIVDYEFHPMTDMNCLRPTDHAFVPCCQIGAATAVNSVPEWGPCIFFTEDHRSFFTKYMTSPLMLEHVVPGSAISGIACGSGV